MIDDLIYLVQKIFPINFPCKINIYQKKKIKICHIIMIKLKIYSTKDHRIENSVLHFCKISHIRCWLYMFCCKYIMALYMKICHIHLFFMLEVICQKLCTPWEMSLQSYMGKTYHRCFSCIFFLFFYSLLFFISLCVKNV